MYKVFYLKTDSGKVDLDGWYVASVDYEGDILKLMSGRCATEQEAEAYMDDIPQMSDA